MEQNLFRRKQTAYEKEQEPIRVFALHDAREELCFAAGERSDVWCGEEHYRYRDFAIVSGDDATYGNYAPQIFAEYGIPVFMDNKKNILFHPFPEFIRAVLEIIEQDFSYESVFRYFRTALTGLATEKVDLLENYVLATGVRGTCRLGEKVGASAEKLGGSGFRRSKRHAGGLFCGHRTVISGFPGSGSGSAAKDRGTL